LILADGKAERLSDDEQPTNGVENYNAHAIHISYMGGVDKDGKTPKDTRTAAQKETMEQLIKEYMLKYPKAQILGHRDFPKVAKACPSFEVKQWLKEIHLA
jgi:N-acetylmuramoyl-L-alanine amidase